MTVDKHRPDRPDCPRRRRFRTMRTMRTMSVPIDYPALDSKRTDGERPQAARLIDGFLAPGITPVQALLLAVAEEDGRPLDVLGCGDDAAVLLRAEALVDAGTGPSAALGIAHRELNAALSAHRAKKHTPPGLEREGAPPE